MLFFISLLTCEYSIQAAVRNVTWCQLGQDNHVEVQSAKCAIIRREYSQELDKIQKGIPVKARDVYYTFTFKAEDDAMELQPVIDKFDEYLNPRTVKVN